MEISGASVTFLQAKKGGLIAGTCLCIIGMVTKRKKLVFMASALTSGCDSRGISLLNFVYS